MGGVSPPCLPSPKELRRAPREGASCSGSTHPWSLDRIAAAPRHEGWGQVFHQMRAEGLVHARNLGQVVRAEHHPELAAHHHHVEHHSAGVTTAAGGMAGHHSHHHQPVVVSTAAGGTATVTPQHRQHLTTGPVSAGGSTQHNFHRVSYSKPTSTPVTPVSAKVK